MSQAKILDKILHKVISIEQRMDNFVTKDDLRELKSDLLGEMDHFVKSYKTLDIEFASLRNKCTRLEEKLGA